MTAKNRRNQILESLESLDHAQAENVLNYIKSLQQGAAKNANYHRTKHEAMIQIRQALGNARL